MDKKTVKLMIIENFINYFSSNENVRGAMFNIAIEHVNESEVDEFEELDNVHK